MVWSCDDVYKALGSRGVLTPATSAPATPEALKTALRLAQQVYREYQRQLFDVNGFKMEGMETVRDCDSSRRRSVQRRRLRAVWPLRTVWLLCARVQPSQLDAARDVIRARVARVLRKAEELQREVEDCRRAAQAAADQVSRWRVIQAKGQGAATGCC
jgi:hypothetical protein